MTKTDQIKTLTEARNALLGAIKVTRSAIDPMASRHYVKLYTDQAYGLIAQVREALDIED